MPVGFSSSEPFNGSSPGCFLVTFEFSCAHPGFLGHLPTAGLESKLSHFHGARDKKNEEREKSVLEKTKNKKQKNPPAAGQGRWALSGFGAPNSAPSFYGDNYEFRPCLGEQWETGMACVPSQRFPGRGLHITDEPVPLEAQCDGGGLGQVPAT